MAFGLAIVFGLAAPGPADVIVGRPVARRSDFTGCHNHARTIAGPSVSDILGGCEQLYAIAIWAIIPTRNGPATPPSSPRFAFIGHFFLTG